MSDKYENYGAIVDVKVEAYKRVDQAEAAMEALNKCLNDYSGYFFEQYEFDWVDNEFLDDIRNRLSWIQHYSKKSKTLVFLLEKLTN